MLLWTQLAPSWQANVMLRCVQCESGFLMFVDHLETVHVDGLNSNLLKTN